MPNDTDYKKACEILRAAVKDADRILRKANLRVSLLLDHDLNDPPDEANLEEELQEFLSSSATE